MSSPTYLPTHIQLATPQGGAHVHHGTPVNSKALTAVILLIAALLAAVVVVGLARGELDTTGVAVTLASILSGIVGGVLLRERSKGP
jgi:hypothetical protein